MKYMCIKINKDNVIRNPNILTKKTQNEGITKKKAYVQQNNNSIERIIESKYAGRLYFFRCCKNCSHLSES